MFELGLRQNLVSVFSRLGEYGRNGVMPRSLFVALPSNRSAATEEEILRAGIVDNFLQPHTLRFSF